MDRRESNRQWWSRFDEKRMTFTIETDDGDQEFPAKYEVCGTCDGKGKHVNPSIDSHGLTAQDFDEDPDLHENYFSGLYDVSCNECHGNRVAPVLDDDRATPEQQKYVQDWFTEEHSDRMTRWYESGCPQ